jgi:hypothetical protein
MNWNPTHKIKYTLEPSSDSASSTRTAEVMLKEVQPGCCLAYTESEWNKEVSTTTWSYHFSPCDKCWKWGYRSEFPGQLAVFSTEALADAY